MNESKEERFKRLAKMRGERVLKDLQLISNLSNKNNYEYNDEDIKKLFGALESALKESKTRFSSRLNTKEIKL
jgi:hypothetical protein